MLKVAYKITKGVPGLPDGFIEEHFETSEDQVEGYLVTSKENFSYLMANNANLVAVAEEQQGIVTKQTAPVKEMPTIAEPVSEETLAARKAAKEKAKQEAELFKQFLAWKASQGI